ncbi:hypothetical protein SNEBB_002641 [Seison nebaliae]|nr:hypothetical protein SNEBB_002641 [Seison nebaliae]
MVRKLEKCEVKEDHEMESEEKNKFEVDERIICLYENEKYEGRCLEKRKNKENEYEYLIHFKGWNKNHDQWMNENTLSCIGKKSRYESREEKSLKFGLMNDISDDKEKLKEQFPNLYTEYVSFRYRIPRAVTLANKTNQQQMDKQPQSPSTAIGQMSTNMTKSKRRKASLNSSSSSCSVGMNQKKSEQSARASVSTPMIFEDLNSNKRNRSASSSTSLFFESSPTGNFHSKRYGKKKKISNDKQQHRSFSMSGTSCTNGSDEELSEICRNLQIQSIESFEQLRNIKFYRYSSKTNKIRNEKNLEKKFQEIYSNSFNKIPSVISEKSSTIDENDISIIHQLYERKYFDVELFPFITSQTEKKRNMRERIEQFKLLLRDGPTEENPNGNYQKTFDELTKSHECNWSILQQLDDVTNDLLRESNEIVRENNFSFPNQLESQQLFSAVKWGEIENGMKLVNLKNFFERNSKKIKIEEKKKEKKKKEEEEIDIDTMLSAENLMKKVLESYNVPEKKKEIDNNLSKRIEEFPNHLKLFNFPFEFADQFDIDYFCKESIDENVKEKILQLSGMDMMDEMMKEKSNENCKMNKFPCWLNLCRMFSRIHPYLLDDFDYIRRQYRLIFNESILSINDLFNLFKNNFRNQFRSIRTSLEENGHENLMRKFYEIEELFSKELNDLYLLFILNLSNIIYSFESYQVKSIVNKKPLNWYYMGGEKSKELTDLPFIYFIRLLFLLLNEIGVDLHHSQIKHWIHRYNKEIYGIMENVMEDELDKNRNFIDKYDEKFLMLLASRLKEFDCDERFISKLKCFLDDNVMASMMDDDGDQINNDRRSYKRFPSQNDSYHNGCECSQDSNLFFHQRKRLRNDDVFNFDIQRKGKRSGVFIKHFHDIRKGRESPYGIFLRIRRLRQHQILNSSHLEEDSENFLDQLFQYRWFFHYLFEQEIPFISHNATIIFLTFIFQTIYQYSPLLFSPLHYVVFTKQYAKLIF